MQVIATKLMQKNWAVGLFRAVDVRKLNNVQIVALVIWAGAFLFGTVFLSIRFARNQDLNRLYDSARIGEQGSIDELRDSSSLDATRYLEKLAQDSNTYADIRVAALRALDAKRNVEADAIAVLLPISKPFIVRHQAAVLLLQHGCTDDCISATLFSLNELWRGYQPSRCALPRNERLVRPRQIRRSRRSVRSLKRTM
jgi:hypothetical protein